MQPLVVDRYLMPAMSCWSNRFQSWRVHVMLCMSWFAGAGLYDTFEADAGSRDVSCGCLDD